MEEAKFELSQLIKKLEEIKGRHTELISVYIPAGFNLNIISNHLSQEQGTAQNIKSKPTRKNVTTALEKILSELRKYKKTPPNGLVFFCGNVSRMEGKHDFKLWAIEPPEPSNMRLYRCDQTFVLQPLKEMLEAKNVYGLISIDNSEAAIAVLKGKYVNIIKKMKSAVPGKMRRGGQSAMRFARTREELKKDWYKKVGDSAVEIFKEIKNFKGIIIGGPGPAKETFYNSPYFRNLKSKVLGIKHTNYSSSDGINELVDNCGDILEKEEIMEEKKLLNEFFSNIAQDTGLAVYGEKEVKEKLEIGAVKILILSEKTNAEKIEEFIEIAKKQKTEVDIVSVNTKEGAQFYEIGGIGGILRYKI